MRIPHGLRAVLASGRRDDDFENTVLLLHGDGTNGAQNNTFIDSSTNNFTITRNGNVTQGTFSPYGDNWSNYFDGSGDYLSINYSSGSTISGDFTFETWVFETGTSAYGTIMAWRNGTSGWSGFVLQRNNNQNNISVSINGSASIIQTSGTYVKNQWNHVALVRSGSTVTLYVNGTSVGTTAVSGSFNPGSSYWIGSDPFNNVAAAQLGGYISNQRFVNGTALYTSNFTPPSSPLTAITNTSLLTCQSNRFRDNSSNAFAITRNGDVSVQRFSPFAPTAAYATSTIGGSGYFDGTGDYLATPSTSAISGTAFTLEGWFYFTGNLQTDLILFSSVSSGGVCIAFQSGSVWGLASALVAYRLTTTTLPTVNAWNHIAIGRAGTGTNQTSIWLNGTRVANGTVTDSFNVNSIYYLGWDGQAGSVRYTGYVSGFRFVTSDVYGVSNASITVPTAPPTAITNTQLLCNFTNAAIIDNTMMNVLETVGNAQISTTQKKYGTGSLYFDGTGDWLVLPHSPDHFFGTGIFTIECWLYLGATGAARGIVGKGTSTTGWLLSTNSTNKVVFTYATSTITSSGSLAGSTWYHIAVVREGTGSNQTKIYIDGINDGTGTVSTDFNQTNVIYVGANRTAGEALDGYIDDLRITKGVARYTANFTPPAAPFADF